MCGAHVPLTDRVKNVGSRDYPLPALREASAVDGDVQMEALLQRTLPDDRSWGLVVGEELHPHGRLAVRSRRLGQVIPVPQTADRGDALGAVPLRQF